MEGIEFQEKEALKLQFSGELPRPPRHKTGEGRSPSLRVEAGSAEGGPERLGAHR